MNGNECAYPTYLPGTPGMVAPVEEMGLTKRELFAAMAMQGLCSSDSVEAETQEKCWAKTARISVGLADALLSELANPTETTHDGPTHPPLPPCAGASLACGV